MRAAAWSGLLAVWLSLPAFGNGFTGPRRFERYTPDDGLRQGQINRVVQDRRGLVWIGTSDGLVRYDGRSFETIRRTASPDSLSDNHISDLAETATGELWVGTFQGLNLFDPKSGVTVRHLHRRDAPDSLGHDTVTRLLLDAEGRLWVATAGGLDRLEPGAERFTHLRHDPADAASLGHDHLLTLAVDGEGGLWVGHRAGLDHLEPEGDRIRRVLYDPRTVGFPIMSVAVDGDGRLWLGTDGQGLLQLEPATGEVHRYAHRSDDPASLADDNVFSLLEDRRGRFWVATLRGLDLFDRETGTFTHHRHDVADLLSLSDDRIVDLFEDRSGLLWISTRSGLNSFDPRSEAFNHFRPSGLDPERSLISPRVRTLHEDRDGDLWIGTTGGLDRLDRGSGRFTHFRHRPGHRDGLAHDHVSAIHEDHTGMLWLGSPFTGLSRFDRRAGTFSHFRHDPDDAGSLTTDDVLTIHEDSSQRLWIGTWSGGLDRFDRATGVFHHHRHDPQDSASLSNDHVFVIHESAAGALWIGTDWAGLDLLEPSTGEVEHYPFYPASPAVSPAMPVQAIHGDDDGTLWVGTRGGGLIHLDPRSGSSRAFTVAHGLPSMNVFGVLEDGDAHLWLSTAEGLSRFDPARRTFRNFDASDGLQGDEFTLHCSYRGRDGTLFFGGQNGFNAVRPDRVEENRLAPKMALLTWRVLGGEISGSGLDLERLELGPEHAGLELEFAALDFTAPEKNQYAYRLGGGGSWFDLGTRGHLTLTRLEPGRTTLHVKGSNNHGVWNEAGVRLSLLTRPPWWGTWWFRSFLVLAIAAAGRWIYLARTRPMVERSRTLQRELEWRQQVEEERGKAAAERERLIAELERRNAELERFTYTVSHDLKSPLLTIRGFLGWLERDAASRDTDRLRRDIEQIDSAAATMGQLLDELLELSRIGRVMNPPEPVDLQELIAEVLHRLAGAIDERGVEVRVEGPLPEVFGDRLRLVEVFQNLIENAVKFIGETPSPRIEISAVKDEEVTVRVRDNGPGIPPAYHQKVFDLFERLDARVPGTGIGLALVRRIVEVHGGTIWVESSGAGEGSTFVLTLPPSASAPSRSGP